MADKDKKETKEAQKMAVKKKFVIMHAKGRTLDPDDITVRTAASRAPTSALLGRRAGGGRPVVMADFDSTDSVFIFDYDPTDGVNSIDFDPTDPI